VPSGLKIKFKKKLLRPLQAERACIRGSDPPATQLNEMAHSRLNWLGCLAGGFYGLQSEISKKYEIAMIYALPPYEGLFEIFSNLS